MNNLRKNRGQSALNKASTLLLLAAQVGMILPSAAIAESYPQALFNDNLPLPELNIAQLEKVVKTSRAKKIAAAKPAVTKAAPKKIAQATSPDATTWIEDVVTTKKTAAAAKTAPVAAPKQTATTKAPSAITVSSAPVVENQPVLRVAMPDKTEQTAAIKSQSIAVEATSTKTAETIPQPGLDDNPEIVMHDVKVVRRTPEAAASAATITTESIAETSSPLEIADATTGSTSATPMVSPTTQPLENDGLTGPDSDIPAPTATAQPVTTATETSAQTTPETTETTQASAPNTVTESAPTATESAKPAVAMITPETSNVLKDTIFIDNDEIEQQESTIEFEALQTDETGAKAKVGARFPIVVTSEITSKTAKVGDTVQGRLKFDLKVGTRLVAEKGSTVRGHINYALKARTPMASLVSANRWYRNSGCLGITFDEIINGKNEHIPLVAEPARQALYVKNKGEGRELGINHKGQITGPWSQQLRYKAVRIGLNAALSPVGAMSFGAMPVALGVIGAANPSFAFMKPVGTNVRHRRIKGFVWGALSGVPGSFLIEDTTLKGQESIIKPGDEFLAEMRQEFTGEPASEAEIAANADMKVKAEMVKHGGKNKKKEKS